MKAEVKFFQLPLSGSQEEIEVVVKIWEPYAFNSLSRDHVVYLEPDPARRRRLSTPSLGITIRLSRSKLRCRCCVFQLPLSGSHGGGGEAYCNPKGNLSTPSLGITRHLPLITIRNFNPSFQLPLSGSRGALAGRTITIYGPAFNSLSRDHRPIVLATATVSGSFNSLSRDHVVKVGRVSVKA